jgi:hypothetical protein
MRNIKLGLFVLLVFSVLINLTACDTPISEDSFPTPLNPVTQPVILSAISSPTIISVQPTTLVILTATPDGFKETSTSSPASNITPVPGTKLDRYQLIGQNLPDQTKVSPGALITITWAIKNIGIVGWTNDYSIRFFSGVPSKKDYYNFPQSVAVGKVANLSVTITAPTTVGNYNTWWKLTNGQAQNFGDVDFSFEVTNSK